MNRNKLVLLVLLFLDAAGFTILFPVLPELVDFYLKSALTAHGSAGWIADTLLWIGGAGSAGTASGTSAAAQRASIAIGGVLTGVYALAQFSSAPFWGRASDRLGRKPILTLTMALMAASSALWIFAGSFLAFIVARILAGIAAGNSGSITAAMDDLSDDSNRLQNMGHGSAALGIGAMLGPVLASAMTAARDSLGLAGGAHPFVTASVLSLVLHAGGAMMVAFVFHEPARHREHPAGGILAALRMPGFRELALIHLLFGVLYTGIEFFLPFFYQREFGLAADKIGLVYLFLGLSMIVGQLLIIPRLTGRISDGVLTAAGFLLVPLPLALAPFSSPNVFLSLVALFPISIGISFIFPGIQSFMSSRAPADRKGQVLGSFSSMFSIGNVIGPFAASTLYWTLGIFTTAGGFAATFLVLGLLMMYAAREGTSAAADPVRR